MSLLTGALTSSRVPLGLCEPRSQSGFNAVSQQTAGKGEANGSGCWICTPATICTQLRATTTPPWSPSSSRARCLLAALSIPWLCFPIGLCSTLVGSMCPQGASFNQPPLSTRCRAPKPPSVPLPLNRHPPPRSKAAVSKRRRIFMLLHLISQSTWMVFAWVVPVAALLPAKDASSFPLPALPAKPRMSFQHWCKPMELNPPQKTTHAKYTQKKQIPVELGHSITPAWKGSLFGGLLIFFFLFLQPL